MADQKKKSGAGGIGGGQEPPEELAEAKAAPANAPSGDPYAHDCQNVCVQGAPPPVGDQPPAPPIRIEPTGPVKVEPTGPVKVSLQRSTVNATDDQALWVAIRTRTRTIGFDSYRDFIERVLCQEERTPAEIGLLNDQWPSPNSPARKRLSLGVDAYQLLKAATEAFLILRCGILMGRRTPDNQFDPDEKDREVYRKHRTEEEARLGQSDLPFWKVTDRLLAYLNKNNLPYVDRILAGLTVADTDTADDRLATAFCGTLIQGRRYDPCMLELIWSYWHEEGMLIQAMHAISLRFQNRQVPGDRNPLANLELHPLRPMSNLLWGYIQDEPFRLTVPRRAYEYSHQYGISLMGKAVPGLRPADHRSKFLEAFHSLLHQVAAFYKEDADTTVIANGFPLLNSLKEVHMLLAEGAHNQFGDLPWTARVEMLMQQWLLSQRELQDFLRGRPMVPYKEPWMGQVDTLRRMFGWGDTPVTHFRDLGTFGEQLLLSIRYGDWINVDLEDAAKNWARYWKPEIQGYVHAYRAATGVDLTASGANQQINAVPPSVLLQRRIARQGVQ